MPDPQIISPGQNDGQEQEGEVIESSSLSKIEEAALQSQVSVAQKFPRSITVFRRQLREIATMDPTIAMEMMYSLPRAGKQLVGPSVRFAEALVSCWKNARVSVEVVDVDTVENHVTAEGRFYDAEANVGFAIRVRRRNVMKRDADGYQVTGQAASSIALRNAILRGVPKALWADIFEAAKETAVGKAASIVQMRDEMVKVFGALGVTEKKVLDALGIAGREDMGADELIAMKAWRKQLNEKTHTVEDIFGDPAQDEVESLMMTMKWAEAKKAQSRQAFKGRTSEHLEYLRAEAAKAGIKNEQPQQQAAPKQEQAKEADTTQQAPTGATSTTTVAASTSQASEQQPEQQAVAQQAAAPKKQSKFDDF